jgi:hypothetical protein
LLGILTCSYPKTTIIDDVDYDAFMASASPSLYAFPALAAITIESSSLRMIQIDTITGAYPFPELATLDINESFHRRLLLWLTRATLFTKLTAIRADATILGNVASPGAKRRPRPRLCSA